MANLTSYCILITFMMIVVHLGTGLATDAVDEVSHAGNKVIGDKKVLFTTSPFMFMKKSPPVICHIRGCSPDDIVIYGLPRNTDPQEYCDGLDCGTCNTLGNEKCNYKLDPNEQDYQNEAADGDVAGTGDVTDDGDHVAGDGDVDYSVPLFRPIPIWMVVPSQMEGPVLIPPPEGSYWVCDKIVSIVYNCREYGCGPTNGWGFCTYLDPSFNPNQE